MTKNAPTIYQNRRQGKSGCYNICPNFGIVDSCQGFWQYPRELIVLGRNTRAKDCCSDSTAYCARCEENV